MQRDQKRQTGVGNLQNSSSIEYKYLFSDICCIPPLPQAMQKLHPLRHFERLKVNIDMDLPAQHFITAVSTPSAKMHFGQLGEDALLWHYFSNRTDGFYVDVGCHHPYRYSNTFLLHRYRGWTGINIDADPRAISEFKLARPGDINLQIGVGSSSRVQEFCLFQDGAVNTFDKQIALSQGNHFKSAGMSMIQIYPLSTILHEHVREGQKIDYLNIDCEGLDCEVLLSNDWAIYRPDIVSVEIHNLNLDSPRSNFAVDFLLSNGYRMSAHYLITTFFERVS